MPQITVVLPTWNRAKWLKTSIESVLSQTFQDFELIVVDDASTDNTDEILESFSGKIRTIFLNENLGVSAARNKAILQSDSKWISFLDSDDYWHAEKLEKQIKQTRLFPKYHIHFTDEIWIRNGIRVNPKNKHRKRQGWIFKPSLALCLMAPSTVMLRRGLLERHGMFDEALPVCEDYDLWLRLTAYHPVALLNEKLMTRQGGHSDQLSRKLWGIDRFRVHSLQKILSEENLRSEDRTAAIQMIRKKCEILIKGFRNRGKMEEIRVYQNIFQKFSEI